MRLFVSGLIAVFVFVSCNNKNDYQQVFSHPGLYSETVHELNQIVMGNNFSPIVASRNYMYATVAAYEVMAAAHPGNYQSLAGQLNGLNDLPKPTKGATINYELAALLAFCSLGEAVTFPEGSMKYYTDSLKELASDHGMPDEELENTINFSDIVSKAILAWSKKDNYSQTRGYIKYTVIDTPGRWMPTPPAYADAMEPHWNKIRPLVLDSASQFVPPPPPPFNVKDVKSIYYKEVMSMLDSTRKMSDEQKHIANFWDDNPFKLNVSGHMMFGTKKFSPPGHWMGIAGIASQQSGADFAKTVYTFALMAIVQFDAFIHCWDEKYRHTTVRPETVINKYFNPDWTPLLQTPPFPEYTCGHSTVSAANAEALTYIFGEPFAYTDSTELEFGIRSRSFKSFRGAALENNRARFYGGIHFHNSCVVSTEYGRKVGAYIISNLKMMKR